MFNNLKNIFIGVLSAVLVIAVGASAYNAFASNDASVTTQPAITTPQGNGNRNGGSGYGDGTGITTIPASDLSTEEAASLLYMREEEKLARDVYNALFTVWGQPTFSNIASSEQQHMDQIKLLIDRYGLTDPALEPGKFTNSTLQALYDQLAAQGSASLADALKVGTAIEEIDIVDLQTRIAQTNNADIQLVYNNLMNGSYNHLRAFASVLTQQTGDVYQPQHLSADMYQSIISGTTGNGNQGGNGNGYGGGNGQSNSGQNGQGGNSIQSQSGNGISQTNIAGAVNIHGVVNSYDGMGISITTDAGQSLYVDTGNMRYSQSLGFAPVAGDGMTVVMFYGNQGVNNAISVTMDSTGVTYTFRSEMGQPLWAGGNGNGNGVGGKP
ncbi:MAG: DUF2202 domain-containing protein [Chloroflexi bacterium]|nr:DUF2202 domain-containing protein [Chloroflexota bacterium]